MSTLSTAETISMSWTSTETLGRTDLEPQTQRTADLNAETKVLFLSNALFFALKLPPSEMKHSKT